MMAVVIKILFMIMRAVLVNNSSEKRGIVYDLHISGKCYCNSNNATMDGRTIHGIINVVTILITLLTAK